MQTIKHFFDKDTNTLTYVVYDEASRDAIIIDPVLDYDAAGGRILTKSMEELINFLDQENLKPHMVLETHAHADHLSSARRLKLMMPHLRIAVGRNIVEVQRTFKDIFDLDYLVPDGHHFDQLLDNNTEYRVGSLSFRVMFTPGHTQACACYVFEKAAFVGDLIFAPDYGTGRCDFPGGSAAAMYQSIMDGIYKLPDDMQLYFGHDYMPQGRELRTHASVAEQKANNIHIKANTSESDFVNFRTSRDRGLSAPRLLYPSVQFNIEAGQLPPANEQGQHFFKIPISDVSA